MVKQLYRVKRDGRRSATSQLISNEKEPIKMLTLAKGNEMKRSVVESQSAKSEEKKFQGQKRIAIGQNRIAVEMPTRPIILAKEEITKN